VKGAGNSTPERLQVIAAYGGADKPGWHGMTIADLDDLRGDLKDGTLGNNQSFIIQLPRADMGDPKSLAFFLSFIREQYRYDRVFLVLIGHGEAYTGMLFDQNHEDDGLTPQELVRSLEETSWNSELIGIDSCLMGCLEVASALSPYARYLIASEESEPAEGWPYETWVRYLTEYPDAQPEEHARVLFDEYMKNTEPGKTIALLHLRETGYLTSELDRFGRDLSALQNTREGTELTESAIMQTQQFGLTAEGTLEEATMDIYDFADKIGEHVPYLSESADGVREGINRTVILARHDEKVPGAHGIAIISPVLINPDFYEYYKTSASITPAWDRFISAFLGIEADKNESVPFSQDTP
ncbi:MAG: clostripain-related cysteine peptidase, partial [Methanospirillum sp.]|nr:clostripain-related cysteine peptidase [Methanospirillum sp.]